MLAVLNFNGKDRQRALELLRWMGELGGCHGHDLMLSCNRSCAGSEGELMEEARKHFDKVELFVPHDENERGWPWSCNHAWRHMVYWIRERVQRDWLWLEPDVVPIPLPNGRIWINEIAAEWEVAKSKGKFFMGCDVDVKNIPGTRRHLSGIAVYPAKVAAFTRRLPELEVTNEAWDMFFSDEFIQFAHLTPLIQHLQFYPEYGDVPTFPTQESLSLLNPQAVLWHRCKDMSMIERLRERMPKPSIPVPEAPRVEQPSEKDALLATIAELERKLAGQKVVSAIKEHIATIPSVAKRRGKTKKKRTFSLEQKQAMRERMAKAREAKKSKLQPA